MRCPPHSRTHAAPAVLAAVALLSLSACVGGEAPSDPYDLGAKPRDLSAAGACSIDGPLPDSGSRASHFPLVDGASWTYHHSNLLDLAWDETATLSATTYQGEDAFSLSDEEDAKRMRLLVDVKRTDVQKGTPVIDSPKPLPAVPYFDLDSTRVSAQFQVEL